MICGSRCLPVLPEFVDPGGTVGLASRGHCVLQLQEHRLRERLGSRPIRLISLGVFPRRGNQGSRELDCRTCKGWPYAS
jgi:hypothetical protein